MASKLSVYRDAALHLGARKLSSLSESTETRRALDDAWDDATAFCLEQGFWNHAMRVVQSDSSASVTPAFGYNYAFTKPSDLIRTFIFSDNERLEPQLFDVVDEAGYWYANCDPLYIKYVSSSTAYGLDVSLWSATFAAYVSIRLAQRACARITGSDGRLEGLLKIEKRARMDALSKDAMNEPVKFPPTNSWVNSRRSSVMDRRRWDGTVS